MKYHFQKPFGVASKCLNHIFVDSSQSKGSDLILWGFLSFLLHNS